jgi:CheY-like chemotaxis protein
MNGRIEVSSLPEQGSVFRIVLPWVASPTLDGIDGAGPRSGFGELSGLGVECRPLTVLYAEDNAVNVELVRHVLRMRPQWQLEVATNGADAIEMALTQPPDLLLLDMHLGDMTGLDVADALSHHPHTMGLLKVALSADVMPDQVRATRERGFMDYLTKPLEVPRLLKLLDAFAPLETAGPLDHAPTASSVTAADR